MDPEDLPAIQQNTESEMGKPPVWSVYVIEVISALTLAISPRRGIEGELGWEMHARAQPERIRVQHRIVRIVARLAHVPTETAIGLWWWEGSALRLHRRRLHGLRLHRRRLQRSVRSVGRHVRRC